MTVDIQKDSLLLDRILSFSFLGLIGLRLVSCRVPVPVLISDRVVSWKWRKYSHLSLWDSYLAKVESIALRFIFRISTVRSYYIFVIPTSLVSHHIY